MLHFFLKNSKNLKEITLHAGFTFLYPLVLLLTLSNCQNSVNEAFTPEIKFQAYCGSCHVPPDPAHVSKSIWENNVLPEMAARLGYVYNGYDPLAKNSMEENLYVKSTNTYPESAGIDSITWKQIHDYIIDLAPVTIPVDSLRNQRNSSLKLFKPIPVSLDDKEISRISSIQFDSLDNQFIIGDGFGFVHTWPSKTIIERQFDSPFISYHKKNNDEYFTEVGYMNPSEKPLGIIYKKNSGKLDTLAKKLHRPVWTEVVDLDNDGTDEILICEYGNLTGELSMLVNNNSVYEKRTLLPVAGTIKVEIHDMDEDGIKDIIVLAAQGNEGLYILYQKNNLTFSGNQVIRLGPENGSSWFETLDYNHDGYLDIVYANGDNADFTIFPKPYHGVRLYINDGKNRFEQKWFYPIYGATRVLTDDFDQDGDYDFAVMSFFPEFKFSPEEIFVYLENKEPEKYLFEPYTFEESLLGRWLVMDKGDFDEDGDMDILMGSMILPPGRENISLVKGWIDNKIDVLLLENTSTQ